MSELPEPLASFDWSAATWAGARREQLRRWRELPLDRIIAALEEMADLAEALGPARPVRTLTSGYAPISGYAPTNGTALYYEISGEGEPIVLLHGFSFDRRMWTPQIDALAARYRVVRYDLRGFGRSAPSPESYSHADDLLALLDHLHIDRAALVGLSMGGGAAINFAILHPDRTRALVAVDPSLGGFTWSVEFTNALGRLRGASPSDVESARERWLATPILAHVLRRPDIAPAFRAMVADYSGWHWTHPDAGRPLVPRAIERLGEIGAPTLVIVGEHDTADFHRIADIVAAKTPSARKVVIEDAGHVVNMEQPERFNRVLLDFLLSLR